ncbi:MAG: cytochrome c [Ardenticatenales bacterium]|nr:cytochrome c [Ardenticatenales bacterium]
MRRDALSLGLSLLLVGCSRQQSGPGVDLAQGKQLYEQNCASCHGVQGEGAVEWQELNADGSYRAPPHTDEGHTWHHPDEQLYLIVRDGGRAPGTTMPAFGSQLDHAEIIAVLEYIKTFWSPEMHASQARGSEAMPYPVTDGK